MTVPWREACGGCGLPITTPDLLILEGVSYHVGHEPAAYRDPIEVYGTPEHEAWLIEMERREP